MGKFIRTKKQCAGRGGGVSGRLGDAFEVVAGCPPWAVIMRLNCGVCEVRSGFPAAELRGALHRVLGVVEAGHIEGFVVAAEDERMFTVLLVL